MENKNDEIKKISSKLNEDNNKNDAGECSKTLDKELAEKQEDKELSSVAQIEEYLSKNEIIFMNYERQMFLDLVHSDALVICGKGITFDRVLINLLKAYSDPGNLILIINHSEWEEKYYKDKLEKKYVHNVANTATERERVYLEGGIQFISTRILVVDLLKNRIPIELITGIFVLRAHTIIESCQEAFALRLYRQKNKTGFIKAFSNSPESFVIGFSEVERIMRNLFLKELYLWPRFHASIQASLKPWESKTIEFHVPMTSKMTLIQTYVLDIMNYLVKEIKRINRSIDLQEITVENCVTKKFHKILQAQLDCVWYQLNSQTKLILSDLKVLRNIMICTIYNDAISTYALIKRYRTTEYAHSNSGWILLDAAEQLFKISKERVYNDNQEFEPESCPKWRFLSEILKIEIPNDIKKSQNKSSEQIKVLILCQDSSTCYQLNQYLTQSGERFLLYKAMKNDIPINKLSEAYKNIKKIDNNTFKESEKKKFSDQPISSQDKGRSTKVKSIIAGDEENEMILGKPEEGTSPQEDELTQLLSHKDEILESDIFRDSYVLTMTQKNIENVDSNDEDDCEGSTSGSKENQSFFEPFPELDNLDITAAVATEKQPMICIQTFKTANEGAMALNRTLNDINPQYVIMYHCNVTAIRQIEIFEARKMRPPNERLKVFFLLHARTVEEQSYLTSLRREKQAFELLIDTKSKMVIPEYQDGKTDEVFSIIKSHKNDDENTIDTRKAGGQKSDTVMPKIIVDMREFRSDLPCLIHRRGIEIVPLTISIGDYILTPEICVERKSISDLIGSLNSGRLYNQCVQMTRFYTKPILLIEFDQKKPFHLQGKYMLSGESGVSSNADIVQRLQLLTLHFPKLRLIWSPSPYATAQIFEELKLDREEPDAKSAAQVGSEESNFADVEKFNPNIYDFMLRLPGINSKNIGKVMRTGGSLKELLKKSREEIVALLDSKVNGNMLYDSLHVAYQPEKSEDTIRPYTSKCSKRGRGRRF